MRSNLIAYVCVFVAFSSIGCISAETPSSWVHQVSDAVNPRPSSFRIQTVAEEDDHLIGRATYRFIAHDHFAKIDGVQTVDGRFWPAAALETANVIGGEWKRLEQSTVSGPAVSPIFKSDQANPALYFNFDGFRPLIGKMKYGRVILPGNGFNTFFELSELLPGKETVNGEPEVEWQARTLYGYGADPLAKSPFYISGIAFEDGHLRAIADYLDRESAAAIVIQGTRTPPHPDTEEEYFWAPAALQVANDPDGEWQTVGQAATPGVPAELTIKAKEKSHTELNFGIDIMRPFVAKFGYGRVVLKNGSSAGFDMKHLLPPTSKR
jgi:hypothetical protein